jgi:pyruvate kinase
VLDGADALMLSGETSIGIDPAGAVATMDRIVRAAEAGRPAPLPPSPPPPSRAQSRQEAIGAAAVRVAHEVGARALVAFTRSGATVASLARHRGDIPLLAFTTEPAVRSRLALLWGVETFVVPVVDHTDDMVRQVEHAMLELGRGQKGEPVVIVAGTPPHVPGTTNMLRVHRLGQG